MSAWPGARAGRAGLLVLLLFAGSPAIAQQPLVTEPLRGLRAEAATMLMQGHDAANLPAAFRFDLRPRADSESASSSAGEGGVAVSVEVAGQPLVTGLPEGAEELTLELYLYLVSAEGAVLGHSSEQLSIPLERIGERLWSSGLRIVSTVELASVESKLSARALLLEPERRLYAMATRDFALDLPRYPAPTLPDDSSWISATSAPLPRAGGASIRPVLSPGPVQLQLDQTDWREGAETRIYSVEIEPSQPDLAGKPTQAAVSGAPIAIQAELLQAQASSGTTELQFELPSLERGSYELRVRSAPANDNVASAAAIVTEPLEIWVLDRQEATEITANSGPSTRGVAGPTLSWPQLLRWDTEHQPAARTAEVTDAGRVFRRLYTELLSAIGKGLDVGSALPRLSELESAVLAGEGDRQDLIRAERTVDLAAIAAEPATILPLLDLRRRAYRQNRAEQRFAAAGHQREMALALARALQPDHPLEIRNAAADLLASLAQTVDRYGLWPESKRILETALLSAPAHESCRILLALLLERQGRYSEALVHVDLALAANSQLKQTRLRRAVLLAHLGRDAESLLTLRSLVAEESSPAVLTVAYQELARLTERASGPAAATRVLQSALVRLPESRSLVLQLASVLDRAGQPREASDVLARFSSGIDGAPSPRLLYTQAPEGLEQALETRASTLVRLYSQSLASIGQ